ARGWLGFHPKAAALACEAVQGRPRNTSGAPSPTRVSEALMHAQAREAKRGVVLEQAGRGGGRRRAGGRGIGLRDADPPDLGDAIVAIVAIITIVARDLTVPQGFERSESGRSEALRFVAGATRVGEVRGADQGLDGPCVPRHQMLSVDRRCAALATSAPQTLPRSRQPALKLRFAKPLSFDEGAQRTRIPQDVASALKVPHFADAEVARQELRASASALEGRERV